MIKFTEIGRAEKGVAVADRTHKFAVGASVVHRVDGKSESDVFRITRQLPETGGALQYRIKGEKDTHERVVAETSLSASKAKK